MLKHNISGQSLKKAFFVSKTYRMSTNLRDLRGLDDISELSEDLLTAVPNLIAILQMDLKMQVTD